MAEITRSSRCAVVAEVTEGTPISPTSSSDYIVLQDGFELTDTFEKIESAELKGSIGAAKPTLGLETSSFSVAHYLAHSGTEGTAPEYNLLLKSLLGTENVQAAERTTTTSSTAGTSAARATVILAAGGTDYSAINSTGFGTAILLKDGTNGYSIRNVYSVSTNTLTLAQNLAVAPATGVTCGKFVNYSPADSAHPSLSVWLYRANGGAVELAKGVKMTTGSIEINANENINMSFEGSGIGYHFDPIEITSSSKYIDITTDSVTDAAATLTVGIYKDPKALAEEISTKITAAMAGNGDTCVCTWNSTGTNAGKFTITAAGTAVFSILWNTGTNTANSAKTKLGYTNSDDTGALFYNSDSVISWVSPQTPSYDNASPIVARYIEVMVGGFADYACFEAQSVTVSIENTKQNVTSICAESGVSSTLNAARAVTGTVVAYLTKHDVDKFYRFRTGQETMVTVNAGSKTGGNWVAGKCVNIWVSRCTLDTHTLGDSDGLVTVNLDFTGYVENAQGECFINFL